LEALTKRGLLRGKLLLAVAVVALALPASASARPGDLDRSFGGGDGTASLGIEGTYGSDLLVQPDGKTVAVGHRWGNRSQIILMRLHPRGARDRSFGGGDGRVTVTDSGLPEPLSVVRQGNGKLIVMTDSRRNVALIRYAPNGELDGTFGGDGTVELECPPDLTCGPRAGPIPLGGGRLAVLYQGFDSSFDHYWLLGRVTAGGELDESFGEGGWRRTPVPGAILLTSMIRLEDGSYVVTGKKEPDGGGDDSQFLVARLDKNGRLDSIFGDGGIALTDLTGGTDVPYAVAARRGGRLIAVGSFGEGDFSDRYKRRGFAVVAYESDGDLDQTFGGDGKRLILPASAPMRRTLCWTAAVEL
jgi:uncharacterized delta-60 repeat protein